MNTPNVLTLLRIAAIPVIVVLFYLPFASSHIIMATIFVIAAFTDWLDGYLARNWEQTSNFGAFLDPVADKLLVAIALVLIISKHNLPFIAIPAAIIVGREIVISGLREWMAELGKRASVAVTFLSKLKTFIQMVALVILLAISRNSSNWLIYLGYFLLWVAALMTLWTMVLYLKTAWPEFEMK